MNITTKYQTTDKGAAKIVAKGGGKQRTLPYDHALSHHANHGAAAGVLANVLNPNMTSVMVTVSVDASTGSGRFEIIGTFSDSYKMEA